MPQAYGVLVLMSVKANMDGLKDGEVLKATASDPGFYEDIKSWCGKTNNELLNLTKEGGKIIALIKKGRKVKRNLLAHSL